MRYAWLLIAIFAARFCVIAVTYPQIDGDISWQRWLGFEILRSGSVPHALGAETFHRRDGGRGRSPILSVTGREVKISTDDSIYVYFLLAI